MKLRTIFLIVALSVASLGASCNKHEAARDSIAANYGWIVTAQSQHLASCQADVTQAKCGLINKAIGIHNSAINALNLYCGGVPGAGVPSYADGGVCVPQNSLESALSAAVSDLNQIIEDIKDLVH